MDLIVAADRKIALTASGEIAVDRRPALDSDEKFLQKLLGKVLRDLFALDILLVVFVEPAVGKPQAVRHEVKTKIEALHCFIEMLSRLFIHFCLVWFFVLYAK